MSVTKSDTIIMEACNAVEREVDKVLSKFGAINEHAEAVLRDLINHIQFLKKDLEEVPPNQELTAVQVQILKQAMTKARDTVQRLATDHRDLHSTVSKVGEAGIKTDEGRKEPFTELNYILDCLKQRNLEPALEWAKKHREALLAQNSSLEFKLHRLHFIRLVQQGPSKQREAILYARQNLTQFVVRYEKEVQSLMGTLLYLPHGIQSSPYSHLLDPTLWLEIHDVFTKEACTLLGLSVDSPLSVCINAGCTALPALLNIKQVMQQRQVTGIWNGKDELPIEIDLGKQSRYHSVFACPILRQQSTENNPPMKLVCGHVISRDALNKLANANKNQFISRLKCPYCPAEQNPEDARLIYF
ncbi:RMD5A protein, partial [Acromyrmex heyeri]